MIARQCLLIRNGLARIQTLKRNRKDAQKTKYVSELLRYFIYLFSFDLRVTERERERWKDVGSVEVETRIATSIVFRTEYWTLCGWRTKFFGMQIILWLFFDPFFILGSHPSLDQRRRPICFNIYFGTFRPDKSFDGTDETCFYVPKTNK